MEPQLTEEVWLRPDPALLRLRRALALAVTAVPGTVLVVLAAVLVGTSAAVGALLVVVALAVLLQLAVERRFHAWGYLEREDDLLVRRGVLVQRLSVVPYGRMQYVDVVAGPLERRYGIATVVLFTAAAATDARIPGLRAEEATRLRDRLASLGEARAAGV